uniref:Ig-like domain-containing protein n=1 Tax=Gouania willdenowi TaxID=441366 RepID=A0A8C5D036_GOUWI
MLYLMFYLVYSEVLSQLKCVSNLGEYDCRDKPVFTPSRLVVKYGDPVSATCVMCKNDCLGTFFGLETPLGLKSENGTTVVWTVLKMTEWNTSPLCYYNRYDDKQCCSLLPVTVYQPLQNVTLTVVNHTGPMFEHGRYTLQCTVEDVFPLELLTVTFFRGQRILSVLHHQLNHEQQDTPVTERCTLSINASEEDDGAQYWCKAELELGSEGPQPPQVRESQALTTTVHCESLHAHFVPSLNVSEQGQTWSKSN